MESVAQPYHWYLQLSVKRIPSWPFIQNQHDPQVERILLHNYGFLQTVLKYNSVMFIPFKNKNTSGLGDFIFNRHKKTRIKRAFLSACTDIN